MQENNAIIRSQKRDRIRLIFPIDSPHIIAYSASMEIRVRPAPWCNINVTPSPLYCEGREASRSAR
jgi:hypothetical protein